MTGIQCLNLKKGNNLKHMKKSLGNLVIILYQLTKFKAPS